MGNEHKNDCRLLKLYVAVIFHLCFHNLFQYMKPLFLIGFMGSGKTTFGQKLAAKLHAQWLDLDAEIAKQFQEKEAADLITKRGIDFFRKAEQKVLHTLNLTDTVVSTGGGTPCFFDNMNWMKQNGFVVFLEINEGVLISRLRETDWTQRPLLAGVRANQLENYVHDLLIARLPFYQQAHIHFNPVKEKTQKLVDQILELSVSAK